jgi:transposase
LCDIAGIRDDGGRKLDHATLEAVRIRAVRQITDGAHPEDVADALGMNRSTVYGWVAKYREGGEAALAAKAGAGPSAQAHRQAAAEAVSAGNGKQPAPAAVCRLRGRFTADEFIDFCQRLLHDRLEPVFLVVDGHPTHRAKKVREFVDATDGQLQIVTLPGYAPELNPDEWVWKNVKADGIGRAGVTSKDDLYAKATAALRRLQQMPHVARGFFGGPTLRYITA